MRTAPTTGSPAIEPATFEALLVALESVYPGKVRRAVDVQTGAINKTIDNEIDAQITLDRIARRAPAPPKEKS